MKCTNEEWLWTVNDAKNECKISFTQVQIDMHDEWILGCYKCKLITESGKW